MEPIVPPDLRVLHDQLYLKILTITDPLILQGLLAFLDCCAPPHGLARPVTLPRARFTRRGVACSLLLGWVLWASALS